MATMKIDLDLTALKFLSDGAIAVLAERRRQVMPKPDGGEGFGDAHDDEHDAGELAWAAVCYAAPSPILRRQESTDGVSFIDPWPWTAEWDKRPRYGRHQSRGLRPALATPLKRRRSMLVKAAAILIAEIDRLDRLAGQAEAGLDEPDLRTDRTL